MCVRYVNGTNKKRIEDHLSQHSFKMIVDGDDRRCNLTLMKYPNQFRKRAPLLGFRHKGGNPPKTPVNALI